MPIDFNRQMIFDPKINIIGNEVPLAEMEKTGDALQERYDKSTEAYNKFKTISKQTEQAADESERQKVRDYNAALAGQIKDIGEKGDMHNMLAETTSLANEAAANYAEFKNRADKIAEYKSKIADASLIKDPVNREYYQNKLDEIVKQTTFNPESKTFNFKSIVMPNMVPTFDFTSEMFKEANGWAPSTNGYTRGNIEVINEPKYDLKGNLVKAPGVYNKTTGNTVSQVEEKEIIGALQKSVAGMPGALESINADTDAYMWKNNIPAEQRDAVYNKMYRDKVLNPINAAAAKEGFKSTNTVSDEKYDAGASQAFGFGLKADPTGGTYTKADVFKGEKEQGGVEFPTLVNSAMKGDGASKGKLYAALDYMSAKYPQAKEAKDVVQRLTDLQSKYPEYAEVARLNTGGRANNFITGSVQGFRKVAGHVMGLLGTGSERAAAFDKEGTELLKRYEKLVNLGFLDSDFENDFEAATKGTPLTRKLPIMSTSLGNKEARELISSWDNNLSIGDFQIIKGDATDFTDNGFKVTGWTQEPYGGGIGNLLELSDGKKTILASPNKHLGGVDIISQLNAVSPGMTSNDLYKDVTPLLYKGQKVTIGEVRKEAGLPPTQFDDNTIELQEDGTYLERDKNLKKLRQAKSVYTLYPKHQ